MSDKLTPEQRSWNMSKIKGKDTSIEMKVRKELFNRGYRYRKNDKRLPGTPDIVLPKYDTVVFINGCFWHRHPNCKFATTPKSNIEFWNKKFQTNIMNDYKAYRSLELLGWKVITIWECEVKSDLNSAVDKIIMFMKS